MRTALLLLGPLLPVLAAAAGAESARARSLAAATGAVAGGLACLAGALAAPAAWPAWGAAGLAWAVIAWGVVRRQAEEGRRHAQAAEAAERWRREASDLERERAALRQDLEKHEREKARAFQIYSLSKSLTESLSWEALGGRFGDVLQKVTGSGDFLLYLSAAPSAGLELKWRSGAWSPDSLPRVAPQKHPQWIPHGGETLLQAPLWQGDDLLGLLWIRWPDAAHPSVEDIEPIFEQLFVGFQKAQLFARMESLSRLDGLTGVLRRQTFMDRLEREWTRARSFQAPFSLMLVDVDHFKRINDTYGHPAGDAVLARLGQLLREGVYETDSVGRYGGEEFGVLLPRAQKDGVRRKAESLRARVEADRFTAGWEEVRVTISIGLAHFPESGRTVAALMESADRALYAAKQGGRNRVMDASELPS